MLVAVGSVKGDKVDKSPAERAAWRKATAKKKAGGYTRAEWRETVEQIKREHRAPAQSAETPPRAAPPPAAQRLPGAGAPPRQPLARPRPAERRRGAMRRYRGCSPTRRGAAGEPRTTRAGTTTTERGATSHPVRAGSDADHPGAGALGEYRLRPARDAHRADGHTGGDDLPGHRTDRADHPAADSAARRRNLRGARVAVADVRTSSSGNALSEQVRHDEHPERVWPQTRGQPAVASRS